MHDLCFYGLGLPQFFVFDPKNISKTCFHIKSENNSISFLEPTPGLQAMCLIVIVFDMTL